MKLLLDSDWLRANLELICAWEFQKTEIALVKVACAISAFWKTHSYKLIPNWTRNRMITYTNMPVGSAATDIKYFNTATQAGLSLIFQVDREL